MSDAPPPAPRGATRRSVLGTPLAACSFDPLTGFHRDGCCTHDAADPGAHVVCVRLTAAFLNQQFELGNDLITPRPQWRFRGLRPGDRWCVCATRWRQAWLEGCAPPVVLEATDESATAIVPLEWLHAAEMDRIPPARASDIGTDVGSGTDTGAGPGTDVGPARPA